MDDITLTLNKLIFKLSKLSNLDLPNFLKYIKYYFIYFKYTRRILRCIKKINSYSLLDLNQLASVLISYKKNKAASIEKDINDVHIEISAFMFKGYPQISIKTNSTNNSIGLGAVSITSSSYDNRIHSFVDMRELCSNNIDIKISRHPVDKETITTSDDLYENIIKYHIDMIVVIVIEDILEDIKRSYYNEFKKNN